MPATSSLAEHVATEIRVALARANITQAEFARDCGWASSSLSRRMTGEIPWSTDDLEVVAHNLRIPLEELLKGAQR